MVFALVLVHNNHKYSDEFRGIWQKIKGIDVALAKIAKREYSWVIENLTFLGIVGDSNSSSSRLDNVEQDEHAESADSDLDLSQSTSSSVAPTATPSE